MFIASSEKCLKCSVIVKSSQVWQTDRQTDKTAIAYTTLACNSAHTKSKYFNKIYDVKYSKNTQELRFLVHIITNPDIILPVMLTRPQHPRPRPRPRPQPPMPRPHNGRPRTQPRFCSIYTGQLMYSEVIFSLRSSLEISQCSISIVIRLN